MNGRCAECKHWRNHVDNGNGFKIHPRPRWGVCLRTYSNGGEPTDTASLANVLDVDWWHAVLETAPDFGCVQFEQRM